MEVNKIFFSGLNGTNNNRPESSPKNDKNNNTAKNSFLISNPLKELLGRCQVNFRGKADTIMLTQEDKNLIDYLAKIYRLGEEDINFLKSFTSDFLKENGKKSLAEFDSEDIFEYANEIAYYDEQIQQKLGLSDDQAMDLSHITFIHIKSGDITTNKELCNKYRYSADFVPYEEMAIKMDLDGKTVADIFIELSNLAQKLDVDSVYDMFSKENIKKNTPALKEAIGSCLDGDSEDIVNNIILEMYILAQKTPEERMQDIKPNELSESFNYGMNTIVIAGALSKVYGLQVDEDDIIMLNSRKSSTKPDCDGTPAQEIAFRIADKYNLPSGAENTIAQIIEKYDVPKFDEEKMELLIQALVLGDEQD